MTTKLTTTKNMQKKSQNTNPVTNKLALRKKNMQKTHTQKT